MEPVEITSPFGYWTGLWFGTGAFLASLVLLATIPLVELDEIPGGRAFFIPTLFFVAAVSAWMVATLTRVRASPEGLWVRGVRGGPEQPVPWHRVRRVEVVKGRRGWAWRIAHRPAGVPGERTLRSPFGPGEGPGNAPPRPLQAVRALWEAAEGPVALETHRWGWRLVRPE